VLVLVEGVDGAGKTTLAHAIAGAMPARIVALPKPTERERTQWYFRRYLAHLPAAGELVVFDRSWYNRAALEPVHGLCSAADCEAFYATVPAVEGLLRAGGIHLIKIFLRVTRETMANRLAVRTHPSALDRRAVAAWPEMEAAHARMLACTPPWIVIDNDEPCGQHAALRALVTALEVGNARARTGLRSASG
jgi:polyphosphate kinase